MKNFKLSLLILGLLTFCVSQAESTGTSASTQGPAGAAQEATNNTTLLNNATTSQKTAPVEVKIWNKPGSKSKDNLTDQEKQLSENFIDQAGANKILKERCSGDNAQVCNGMEGNHKIMGMDPGLIKAASQAYALFGAMGDIMPMSAGSGKWFTARPDAPANKTGTNGQTPNNSGNTTTEADKAAGTDKAGPAAEKKEKPDDYCKYIPTFTEGIATFAQKNTVQSLNNGGETSQKEQLLKAAKSHEGRAEQAQIQAAGWFGGAACYAINAASGNFATDKNLIIKTAAAVFLGAVYQGEVSANKGYAKETRAIAEALPSKGACNPITENECYCATPEYANDPHYCKEQIAKRNGTQLFTKTACTDNRLKLDPSCSCEKSNSCFDKVIENSGIAEIQLGIGGTNSPFKSLASLAHGRLEAGTLNGAAYANTSAIAKKALNEFASKVPMNNAPLTQAQKEVALALTAKGIPSAVAHLMASNPPPQSAINAALAKTQGLSSGPAETASYSNYGKNNVVDFNGGNGLGVTGNKKDKRSGSDDFMKNFATQKGNNASNAKILEFAQKAEQRASQITKTDRPIFEIISNRYQTSGRRLLQLESN